MKAIILVGGQGTRMRPLTDHLPKNIVPLCGVPFLTYQFEYLKKAGVREVVLSMGYRPDDIRKVYGDGRRLGLKIRYVAEKEPLGTAGAVKNAERLVKGSPLVVLNGDILTDIPLKKMIAFHRKNRNLATLGLFRVEDPSAYGLVLLDGKGRIQKFLEKPSPNEVVTDTINAGVYVFEPGVFGHIPADVNYSAERGLFPGLLAAGEPFGGFVWKGYWQDIGTPRKYLTTQWDVLDGAFRIPAKFVRKKNKVFLGKGVKIGKGALLRGPAVLGDGCRVEEGAQILPYAVLGKKCVAGRNSSVSKSVLWEGVRVGEGVHLEEVVLGRRCSVPDHSKMPPGSVLGDDAAL
jgi:NDP-sugar pyrophosphorylase family protein